MKLLRLTFCLAALLSANLVSTDLAKGEPGPIELISKSAIEQADEATEPALSSNGRFIAFQGKIGGFEGIFRKDLATGAIAMVSGGSENATPLPLAARAMAPSISADGRYVSFTTRAPLDPTDDPGVQSKDVYVADMSTTPPTYELASALNGSKQGLSYEGTEGSIASGRVALSADGRKVVFVITAPSNLTKEAGGSTPGEETPAGQVALRNLETNETTLVSTKLDPLSGQTELPVAGGAVSTLTRSLGAALSADGTTVAWLGNNLPAQVPLLTPEEEEIRSDDENGGISGAYDEPLWRRVADGSQAPTRRITGGVGDSQAPGCPPGGTPAEAGCRGVFSEILEKTNDGESAQGWLGVSQVNGVPQLSADGRTVALLGNPTTTYGVNLYLVDMAAGLSRAQAVRQLTREVVVNPTNPQSTVNIPPFIPQNGHIWDLAISTDGTRIAFATARQQFPLSPPSLIGSAPTSLGLVELYLIDLDGGTIQRLTHGDGGSGEPSLGGQGQSAGAGSGATAPSFAEGGELISFASSAFNLVPGDGNESSDVFTVSDPRSLKAPGVSALPPRLAPLAPRTVWRLHLSAVSLPDGKVRVLAAVPGRGSLRVGVGAHLKVGTPVKQIASAQKNTSAARVLKVTVTLPRHLRSQAHGPIGLVAGAKVAFRSKGQKTLRGQLQLHFHVHRHGTRKGK